MPLAPLVQGLLGWDADVAVQAFDGSRTGPAQPRATLVIHSPDALRRVVWSPGELGFARAYVAGDLDVDGELSAVLEAGFDGLAFDARTVGGLGREALRACGRDVLHPLPPPEVECVLRGGLHTRRRDIAAISHHYDVSNDFYRLVLGEAMTYSCAVFDPGAADTLERAQQRKHELVADKLDLHEDMRLLDVGCGWGGMVLHAVEQHGVQAVGVTISEAQAALADKRVAEAGQSGCAEIRLQDYRDVEDGPYDAISSIGMFEHVGRRRLETYFQQLHDLVRPGGRVLNHAISRPALVTPRTPVGRARARARAVQAALGSARSSRIDSALLQRYVFPDGELHEVGTVVTAMQEAGFEVRHVESLREHYARTLRCWVANLEQGWDDAVDLVGEQRARVWRIYMTACALAFERGRTSIHQVLAVRPTHHGSSRFPLRPSY